jgi:hypothetical protein
VQPSFIMVLRQSQQAWIISAHLASPLVQVIVTPLSVRSHLHMPIVKLQQQTIMPFIMQQQLHMPPAMAVQRFCSMPQAIWSSQVQVMRMPPWIFSILTVQRGTITMDGAVGTAWPWPIMPAPGMPAPIMPPFIIAGFIIIVVLAMTLSLS